MPSFLLLKTEVYYCNTIKIAKERFSMEEKKETFEYTYYAKQQQEIEKIRSKYLPKQESKMDQLRRLDQSATKKGTNAALSLGVTGCLLLGFGMCCTMVWAGQWFLPGMAVGLIGIAAAAIAYPLYTHLTKKQREKLAPQILKLTEELSKSE